jgi:hypothetical protein
MDSRPGLHVVVRVSGRVLGEPIEDFDHVVVRNVGDDAKLKSRVGDARHELDLPRLVSRPEILALSNDPHCKPIVSGHGPFDDDVEEAFEVDDGNRQSHGESWQRRGSPRPNLPHSQGRDDVLLHFLTTLPADGRSGLRAARGEEPAAEATAEPSRFGAFRLLISKSTGHKYGARAMRSAAGPCNARDMDTTEIICRRLEQAKVRRDAGAPFSPDWDAAMAEIDDMTARLAGLAILARALPRVPAAA